MRWLCGSPRGACGPCRRRSFWSSWRGLGRHPSPESSRAHRLSNGSLFSRRVSRRPRSTCPWLHPRETPQMTIRRLMMACAALAAAGPLPVCALDNALTYQGVLAEAGQPATGFYDFNFALLSATGTPLAAPVFLDNVQVTQGAFSVT